MVQELPYGSSTREPAVVSADNPTAESMVEALIAVPGYTNWTESVIFTFFLVCSVAWELLAHLLEKRFSHRPGIWAVVRHLKARKEGRGGYGTREWKVGRAKVGPRLDLHAPTSSAPPRSAHAGAGHGGGAPARTPAHHARPHAPQDELLLFGLLSLLLPFITMGLSHICIPLRKAGAEGGHTPAALLAPCATAVRRLLSAAGSDAYECGIGEWQPFSATVLHDTHVLLFMIAVAHVLYAMATMLLTLFRVGRLSQAGWRGRGEGGRQGAGTLHWWSRMLHLRCACGWSRHCMHVAETWAP